MAYKACAVGGLLYTPASSPSVADHLLNRDWPCVTAVSLCLEDSIRDEALADAEHRLALTLARLSGAKAPLPMLFVRVRTPEHLRRVHGLLGEVESALTGYIFPKCDLDNARDYFAVLADINRDRARPLYAMPILESRMFAEAASRRDALRRMRGIVDENRDVVLNVRVGGNDFSNLYGLRRSVGESIYDLGVVRDILVDILNLFSDRYVVSGPVWEYYGSDPNGAWAEGLRRELRLDRANGFLGKTAIHPSQLPLIFESMKVSAEDEADARSVLGWSDEALGVSGGVNGRMNEVKCHTRWADRILLRSKIYGVRPKEGTL